MELIQEELEKRDILSQKVLQQALKRTPNIDLLVKNGALTTYEQGLLSKKLVDSKIEKEKEQELLLNKMQGEYSKLSKQQVISNQEKIRQLNELKFQLQEKEQKVKKEKKIQEELNKKGINFLAEIELGHAPPVELIKKNIQVSDDSTEGDKPQEYLMQEVIQKSKKVIEEGTTKLQTLRKEVISS